MYGKTHTIEARNKIIETNKKRKGIKRTNPMSDKTKKKLSDVAKLRTNNKNPFYGKHHSEKTKKLLRDGSLNRGGKKVLADGVTYLSLAEAERTLGVKASTINYRIKTGKYKYV